MDGDFDAVAKQAMGIQTEATVPNSPLTKSVRAPQHETPKATGTKWTPPKIKFDSTTAWKVAKHPAFRLVVIFIVAVLVLVIINPPFVHSRRDKNDPERNELEAASCSYGRVMVSAAIITTVAALVPLALQHQEKIIQAYHKIEASIRRISAKSSSDTTPKEP